MTGARPHEMLRPQLAQYLSWLGDPGAPPLLRDFARSAGALTPGYLSDERALSDVVTVVHRALDRGDWLPVALVHELPLELDDGRETTAATELSLGRHAFAIGATEPLIDIAQAMLLRRRATVPAEWMCCILEAESRPDPRAKVISVLHDWLDQEGVDPAPVDGVLRLRPALHATLFPVDHDPKDIVSAIRRYVRLDRRGDRFVGCCPFHDDSTPSFFVNPKSQTFICYGCRTCGTEEDFVDICDKLGLPASSLEPVGDP
ncbi:MAG: CHC2 zinc finger domain-containing protein [Polyangiaceae bacterium]